MAEADRLVDAGRPDPLDDPGQPPPHRQCVLAAGAAVEPDPPARVVFGADLFAGEPLVVAVIPFGEVRFDLGVGETGQSGGLAGPLARAGQHQPELGGVEALAQRAGLPDTVCGEFQIGHRGVLPRFAPLGFTMPDEVEVGHAFTLAVAPMTHALTTSRKPFDVELG